ncbi:hypothetical protein ACIQF6_28185 [Kitasatospora sp. NPDC092948]|uniref:hypothetical protein n=1 Tax=Kitasatospora sp. NPDC092948 TaxID=3364088 RepID=UPI0037F13926
MSEQIVPAAEPVTETAPAPQCPRCRRNPIEAFAGDTGAGSRMALARSAIRICGDCGVDEAVRDARGLAPIPLGEWPYTGELLTWTGAR